MNHIDEDGGTGLKALLDTYDWDKYDAEDIYSYISGNYGDDDEVMAIVDEYYGIPFTDTYMRRINNEYGDGTVKKISGGYDIKDNPSKQDVISFVASDESLSDDEKMSLLYAYGISTDELEKWAENNKQPLGTAAIGFIKGIADTVGKVLKK